MLRYLLLFLILSASSSGEVLNVYFGTGGGSAAGIYHTTLDTKKGRLGQVTLAAEVTAPGFLAWNVNKDRLYSISNDQDVPALVAYAVQQDGKIEEINRVPMQAGRAAHLAVHPSESFLITAHYGSGKVSVFPVAADGSIHVSTQIIQHKGASGVVEKRQKSPHPHWAGFSPDGKYAFIPDLGADQIVIYSVEPNSVGLKQVGTAKTLPGGGPRHMRFSPDGNFIYLLNELTLAVTTFKYNPSNGSAQRLTTTPALTEEVKAREVFNSASEILVHPNGKFLYSGNRGNDSVTVYAADPNSGELKVIEVEPVRGAWPRNINLDSTGSWLLAAGADSNTVSLFRIDPDTGELQFQRKGSINVPNAICILLKD
ncbi:MAG: lactonase family protein [Verrucomicrobiota bacterium]